MGTVVSINGAKEAPTKGVRIGRVWSRMETLSDTLRPYFISGGASMRCAIVLVVLLALPTDAWAVETGAEAQKSCGRLASERLGNTIIEGAAAGHCLGMIGTVWLLGKYLQDNMRFCTPAGVKPEQGTKVLLKYLANHPERLHEPDVLLAVLAFREVWPCKN